MRIQIPKRHEKAFVALMSCSEEQFESILDALGKAQPALLTDDLASEVSSHSGAPIEVVGQIFQALAGLYLLLDQRDITRESLVDQVIAALQMAESKELHLEEAEKETFRDRLARALGFEGVLGITSKAMDVKLQHERWFCRSRVLTDLRPIFPFGVEGTPSEFLIGHTLMIRYHEGSSGDAKEFSIALDAGGIEDLVNVLQRAKRKEEMLKLILQQASLKFLEGSSRCV